MFIFTLEFRIYCFLHLFLVRLLHSYSSDCTLLSHLFFRLTHILLFPYWNSLALTSHAYSQSSIGKIPQLYSQLGSLPMTYYIPILHRLNFPIGSFTVRSINSIRKSPIDCLDDFLSPIDTHYIHSIDTDSQSLTLTHTIPINFTPIVTQKSQTRTPIANIQIILIGANTITLNCFTSGDWKELLSQANWLSRSEFSLLYSVTYRQLQIPIG